MLYMWIFCLLTMVKIYTKTGDKGETSLFGGTRIAKSDARVAAYGTIDELTSFLGLLIAYVTDKENRTYLTSIQTDLYTIMGELAGAPGKDSLNEKITGMEKKIDEIEEKLKPLTRFILPQGGVISGYCHVIRTVCRRAERSLVEISADSTCIAYLNRLSDYMFVLARYYTEGEEVIT